jgi:hypothetical protein
MKKRKKRWLRLNCWTTLTPLELFDYKWGLRSVIFWSTLLQLWAWKERGLIRYVGATSHNRPISLDLINSDRFDVPCILR